MSNTQPRKLIIAGGSGFLGQGLADHLLEQYSSIVILTRGPGRDLGTIRHVHWDARTLGPWAKELDGAAAVVNFVGRSVDCRKNAANKKVILDSRIDSVTALAAAMRACTVPPPVWIQSATAHIFGDTQDEFLDESSPVGSGFAPMVGTRWETALNDHAPTGIRTVILRISFVLGKNGGALRTLARLARLGLGGTVGSGNQYMSWIHERDLHRIVEKAIDDSTMNGVYVVTAPQPETNRDFMRAVRQAVRRPWSPPVPAAMVRLGSVVLRTDPELVLLGRRCVPTRLLREQFHFDFPTLASALDDLL